MSSLRCSRLTRSGAAVLLTTTLALAHVATASWASVPAHLTQETISFSFVGDTDLGNTPALAPDPSTYLALVAKKLSADIEFFNLEGTLTTGGTSKCANEPTNCFAFKNPPSFAKIYRAAGFTVANSANNHSNDYGAEGVRQTSQALSDAGIVQAGLPGQIGIVTVHHVKVAFCDFAPYPYTNDMLNYTAEATLIGLAKKKAAIVVVYMHAGAEGVNADHVTGSEEYYDGEDRGNPEKFAHEAILDGADLVVASAPHTLRGMEFFHHHLIDYSMGDFASYYNFATNGTLDLSGILKVTLTATGSFVSARFISTKLVGPGQPKIDSTLAGAHFVAALSTADFHSNAPSINFPTGRITPPLPIPPA